MAAKQANVPYSGPPLDTGDVIYSVSRHVVSNVFELRQVLGAMKAGDPAVLLIERDGHLMYLALELD